MGEEGTTTTVQFIAVSADEHARMVAAGELPASVHGADVHMQIPGAEAQQVKLSFNMCSCHFFQLRHILVILYGLMSWLLSSNFFFFFFF